MSERMAFHFDAALDPSKVDNDDFRSDLRRKLKDFDGRVSCYFAIAVPQVTYTERSLTLYSTPYSLSIHCSTSNRNDYVERFIEWIMPYIDTPSPSDSVNYCLGYKQWHTKAPEFIFWRG